MNFDMRPKNLPFFVWGTAIFLVFFVVFFLEMKGIFLTFDPGVTSFLQTIIPRSLDRPLSIFTLLGSFEVTFLTVLAIIALVYRKKRVILFSLILFGAILVFEYLGKLFLFYPSPPSNLLRYDLPFHFIESPIPTKYSFPSGHTSRTIFIVVIGLFLTRQFVVHHYRKFLIYSLFILGAILMIVSRVYLGEHWISDVIGGILLGSSMGLLSLVYY